MKIFSSLRGLGLAVTVVGVLGLVACTPSASPPPTATSSSPFAETPASSTPSVTPLAPSAFPCSDPAPAQAAPTQAQRENYQAVIASANTQPMASHACATVTFIISGSECCGPLNRDDALVQWGDWLSGKSDWNFSPDAAMVADWRTHFYGQYIPEGSLIAVSDVSGVMTSVVFDGDVITALFAAHIEEMSW